MTADDIRQEIADRATGYQALVDQHKYATEIASELEAILRWIDIEQKAEAWVPTTLSRIEK